MRFVFTVLFVSAGLLIMWSVAAVRVQGTPNVRASKLDTNTYNSITMGMTKEQVVQLVGSQPLESDTMGSLEVLNWQEATRARSINVTLKNGKVINKTNGGLTKD